VFQQVKGENVHLLDPAAHLCDSSGFCHAVENERALYSDNNHLSFYGAMKLRPMFEPMFREIANREVHHVSSSR
jgi:hypothetical protein